MFVLICHTFEKSAAHIIEDCDITKLETFATVDEARTRFIQIVDDYENQCLGTDRVLIFEDHSLEEILTDIEQDATSGCDDYTHICSICDEKDLESPVQMKALLYKYTPRVKKSYWSWVTPPLAHSLDLIKYIQILHIENTMQTTKTIIADEKDDEEAKNEPPRNKRKRSVGSEQEIEGPPKNKRKRGISCEQGIELPFTPFVPCAASNLEHPYCDLEEHETESCN
jgi:hypothetical protein